jgi:Uncharacterized protein conserved in archaea
VSVFSLADPAFWRGLLRAELILTCNVVVGLFVGEVILSSGVVDRLFAPVIPRLARWGIHNKVAAALLMALGSPKTGAALIAASYADGEITRDEATYGTLALAFPAYLKRWVVTASTALSIAGRAGLIYALVLVSRSAVRFVWLLCLLRRSGVHAATGDLAAARPSRPVDAKARRKRLLRTVTRSLPWAWAFFAVTYALIPLIERFFTDHVAQYAWARILPPQGWAVAVSALAHVTAALSAARGVLAAGDLNVPQAVLALLIGNMIGTITRMMRQNVGYWMGIFPRELMGNLIRWHLATTLSLEAVSILIAWCAAGVMGNG